MSRRLTSAAAGVALVAAALQLSNTGPAAAAGHQGPAALKGVPVRHSVGHLSQHLSDLATSASLRSKSMTEQAHALGSPVRGPGSMMRRGDKYVVEVRLARLDSGSAAAIRRAGGTVLHVSRTYDTITAAVPAGRLRSVDRVPHVASVMEVLTPTIAGSGDKTGPQTNAPAACPQGSIKTEGDTQLRADLERQQVGGTGKGVTVGVLSDSFGKRLTPTSPAQDVASGDLPGTGNSCGQATPVNVIDDSAATGLEKDEGRAMLQVVHDLAPDANLAFATAFTSETAFADNIVKLQSQAGASTIVDDVSYADEPVFQEGPIANAASTVVSKGATYFSSAANNNLIVNGQNVASWESPTYRATPCPAGIPGARDCENFSPSGTDNSYGVTVAPNGSASLVLQWAQPWAGVTTDLDFYVTDAAGQVIDSSLNNSPSVGEPFESLDWTNGGTAAASYNVYVVRKSSGDQGTPRLKLMFNQNGDTRVAPNEYVTSAGSDIVGPAIFGHNGGASVMSTAAVPYNNSGKPEDFSSRGPVTHYFGPVNGNTPAAALGAPQVLSKPNIAATDGGATTFFGEQDASGAYRFYGTSEAAPHAAAVSALQRSVFPNRPNAALNQAQQQTARPVGAYGPNDVGHGLVDALGATQILGTSSLLSVTTSGSGSVASSDGKLNCGPACQYLFGNGSTVTLTATPGAGTTEVSFSGCDSVSGNTCSVVMSGDRGVSVTFGADAVAPSVKLAARSFTVQLKRKIHLFWSGDDHGGSGVASYKVQVAQASYSGKVGKYKTSKSLSGTARQGVFKGSYGNTYCFRVKATDALGNASKFTKRGCVGLPVDDRKLTASKAWHRTTGDVPSKSLSVAKKHGATLTLKNVRARRLGVALYTCRGCGKVGMWFNGHKLQMERGHGRRGPHAHSKIVFAKPFSKIKKGTVTIKVLSSGRPLKIDGLVASFAKNPAPRLSRTLGLRDQG